jgi:CDP-diglyceride synthetase
MKIFLIIFGIIVVYIFIGVLCYWISILIDYKKSKTKRTLNDWLNEICDEGITRDTRESSYFYLSMFWIVTLPFYIIVSLFYFIGYLFSNIIKSILKINKLDGEL